MEETSQFFRHMCTATPYDGSEKAGYSPLAVTYVTFDLSPHLTVLINDLISKIQNKQFKMILFKF